ncbi:MAG TPA: cupin domain-containing protein [Edaphobacter sp.]
MTPQKTFRVFGEKVEILTTSESTKGSFCMLVQTSPPGGGPPPHVHAFEDEIFSVLEGEFELFDGREWSKVAPGQHVYTLRGQPHTFRNAGTTDGRILCIAVDGRLDEYLEAISPLEIPRDIERLMSISKEYGITFLAPEPPAAAPV